MPKNNSKSTTWLKNLGRSVGYGIQNVAKQRYSTSSQIHEDFVAASQDITKMVQFLKQTRSRQMELLRETKIGKLAADSIKETSSSLKTGEFVKDPDSIDDFGDDFNFGDDDFNMDDDMDMDEDFSSSSTSSTSDSHSDSASGLSASDISSLNRATIAGSKMTAASISHLENTVKSSNAITLKGMERSASVAAKLTMGLIAEQRMVAQQQIHQLEVLSLTTDKINTFNTDVMGKFVEGSLVYYEESLKALGRIVEIQELSAPKKKDMVNSESDFDSIFGMGGLNFGNLGKRISKNFEGTMLGMAMSTFSMMGEMGPMNIAQTLLEEGITRLIPQSIDTAIKTIDSTIGNLVFPIIKRITDTVKKSQNPLLELFGLGDLLNIDASTKLNTSRYEKGPVPFDGITHRTINQVIPTYLSKILAAINKQGVNDEMYFDHDVGKWTSRLDLKRREDSDLEYMRNRATSPFRDKATKFRDSINFNSEEDEKAFNKDLDTITNALIKGELEWNGDIDKMLQKNVDVMLSISDTMTEVMKQVSQNMTTAEHLQMLSSKERYESDLYRYNSNSSNLYDLRLVQHDNFGIDREEKLLSKREQERAKEERKKKEKEEKLAKLNEQGGFQSKIGKFMNNGADVSNYNGQITEDQILYNPELLAKHTNELYNDPTKKKEYSGGLMKYLNQPISLLTDVIHKVDKTIYDVIFGTDEEGSIVGTAISKIKDIFGRMQKIFKEQIVDPAKKAFQNSTIKKQIENFGSRFLDGAKEYLLGEKKGDSYEGGMFSFVRNALGDAGKYVKQIFNGKDFISSEGKTIKATSVGIAAEMKAGFDTGMGYLKAYLFGDNTEKGNEAAKKTSLLGNIAHTLSKGFMQFSNTFLGTKLDERQAFAKFGGFMKREVPSILGKGAVIGTALGALKLTGGAGVLGSLFLPGGPIGALIAGTGIAFLSKSERFKSLLFGKKDDDGKRTGGIISRSMQRFWSKHKTAIIGGGLFGGVKSILGGALTAAGLGLGPIGILPGMAAGFIGPVLMGSATGLALKSKRFQEIMFGKPTKDGTKKGGIMNSKFMTAFKKSLPGISFGALSGGLLGTFGSSFGLAGSLVSPIGLALAGGAIGLGLASEKFKTALFGKFDKNGNYKSGLIDRFQNLLTVGVVNPLKYQFAKGSLAVEKWFTKSIANPLKDSFVPLGLMAKDVAKTIKDKLVTTFTNLGKALIKPFNPMIDAITGLLKHTYGIIKKTTSKMVSTITWTLGKLLSSPVKLLSLAGGLAAGVYDSKVYKAGLKNSFKAIGSAKGVRGKLSAIGSFINTGIGGEIDPSMLSGSLKTWAEYKKEAKERNAKQDKYFSRKEAALAKVKERHEAFANEVLANGGGLTKKQIAQRLQEEENRVELAMGNVDNTSDAIAQMSLEAEQESLDVQKEQRSLLANILALGKDTLQALTHDFVEPDGRDTDDNPTESIGANTAENLLNPLEKTANNIARNNGLPNNRHEDDNPNAEIGGQTADKIVKERREEAEKEEAKKASERMIAALEDNSEAKKTNSFLSKLWDGIKMAGVTLGGMLSSLGTLGVIAASIGKIYDIVRRLFGDDGEKDNSDGTSQDRLIKDSAAKTTVKAAYAHGDTVAKYARLAKDKVKALPGKAADYYRSSMQDVKNVKMFRDMGIDVASSEKTTLAGRLANRYYKTSETLAESRLVQKVAELSGKAADSVIGKAVADKSTEYFEQFKNFVSKGMDAIANNETVKEKMGPGLERMMATIRARVAKVDVKVFKVILPKFTAAVAKTAGVLATAGIAQAIFSAYDAYSGFRDAAALFNVREEDVTAGMRIAASIMQVIMGLPYIIFVDMAFEAISLFTGGALDFKSTIAVEIYKNLPSVSDEDIEKLKTAQENDAADKEAFEAKTGKKLTRDAWIEEKNKRTDEKGGAMLVAARQTDLGKYLFGDNDPETGEYKDGLFSNMKKGIDNNLAYLFGEADTEDGYEGKQGIIGQKFDELKTAIGTGIDKIGNGFSDAATWFTGGTYTDGTEVPSLMERFKDGVVNNLKWLFGEVDDEGNVTRVSALYKGTMSVKEFATKIGNGFSDVASWIVGGIDSKGEAHMALPFNIMNGIARQLFGVNILAPSGSVSLFSAKVQLEETGEPTIVDKIKESICIPFSEFCGKIETGVNETAESVGKFFTETKETISQNGLLVGTWKIFYHMFTGLTGIEISFDPVQSAINNLRDGVSDFFGSIGKLFIDMKKWISSQTPSNVAKSIMSMLIDPVKKVAVDTKKSVSDAYDRAIDYIKDSRVGKVFNSITTLGGTFSGAGEGNNTIKMEYAKRNNTTATQLNTVSKYSEKTDSYDNPDIVTYRQDDSRWSDISVLGDSPTYGSMKDYGCGPTVLASAMANVTGNNKINPKITSALVQSSDVGLSENKGVSPAYFAKAATELGGEVYNLDKSRPDAILDSITSGGTVILGGTNRLVSDGPFTKGGHYVMASGGYVKDGKPYINVYDPLGKRTGGYPVADIMRGINDRQNPGFASVVTRKGVDASTIIKGASYIDPVIVSKVQRATIFRGYGPSSITGDDILATGKTQEGLPYDMGSDGESATDCGMFTMRTFGKCGIDLGNRCADEQAKLFQSKGALVDPSEAKPGDLVFFQNTYQLGAGEYAWDDITHVGIYAGNNTMLHAGSSRGVCFQELDGFGIPVYKVGSIQKAFGIEPGKGLGPGGISGTAQNGTVGSKGATQATDNRSPMERFLAYFAEAGKNATTAMLSGKVYQGTPLNPSTGGSSGGNYGPISALSGDSETNAKLVYKSLKKFGYSDTAAAGIMGRLRQENNFNTNYGVEYDSGGTTLGGAGMIQWNGARREALVDFAAQQNVPVESAELQVAFMKKEIDESYPTVQPSAMNNLSPTDAVERWRTDYEVGEWSENDAPYANDFYSQIQSGKFAGAGNKQSGAGISSKMPTSSSVKHIPPLTLFGGGLKSFRDSNTTFADVRKGYFYKPNTVYGDDAIAPDYDELGNIKAKDLPMNNLVTKDDSITVIQGKQEWQRQWWASKSDAEKEAIKKTNKAIEEAQTEKEQAVAEAEETKSDVASMVEQIKAGYEAAKAKLQGTLKNSIEGTVDPTSAAMTPLTGDSMAIISAINALNITAEAQAMVKLLEVIANKTTETAAASTSTADAMSQSQSFLSSPQVTGIAPTTSGMSIPGNITQKTRQKQDRKSYDALHAENLKIAKGGEFKRG